VTSAPVQRPPTLVKRAFTAADLKAQFPQNAAGAYLMEVSQLLNTVTDPEVQALLEGQPVETSGQIMRDSRGTDAAKPLRLWRAELLCCSSHLRECSVGLSFSDAPPAFAEKAWVKLTGTLTFQAEGTRRVPILRVREAIEVPAPASPILK
jgi:uncharacterized membrane protein YcgQ (UPF0703/DUF1980 family)